MNPDECGICGQREHLQRLPTGRLICRDCARVIEKVLALEVNSSKAGGSN